MNSAKRTLCVLAVLSAFGVSLAHAQGADHYTLTELGSLGASASPAVLGTNSQGLFVGMAPIADGTFHGFVLVDGVMKDLGTLGGPGVSEADAINAAGTIVGATRASLAGPQRAVRLDGATLTDFGPGVAIGINTAGQVLVRRPGDNAASLIDADGTDTPLPIGPIAINDSGQMLGWTGPSGSEHSVILQNATSVDLGTLGGQATWAYAMNNAGDVVGWGRKSTGIEQPAFLYRGGVLTELPTIDGTPSFYSIAHSINNHGLIVGEIAVPSGGVHAFISDGVTTRDLNDLIPPNAGFVLTMGAMIADNGAIIAQATRTGPGPYQYSTVLLTPTPLPPSTCGTEVSTAMVEARFDYVIPGTPIVLSFLAIGNKTSAPIPGPISLVMDTIGNGLYLGLHATTGCFSTQGGSFVPFAPGTDNVFAPGEYFVLPLFFGMTGTDPITYNPRIISGVPMR